MNNKKKQISDLWCIAMEELLRHVRALTYNVNNERWKTALFEQAAAKAVRDLAVRMFDGFVTIQCAGKMLSLAEIDRIIDGAAEIIATNTAGDNNV